MRLVSVNGGSKNQFFCELGRLDIHKWNIFDPSMMSGQFEIRHVKAEEGSIAEAQEGDKHAFYGLYFDGYHVADFLIYAQAVWLGNKIQMQFFQNVFLKRMIDEISDLAEKPDADPAFIYERAKYYRDLMFPSH